MARHRTPSLLLSVSQLGRITDSLAHARPGGCRPMATSAGGRLSQRPTLAVIAQVQPRQHPLEQVTVAV